MPHSNAAPNAFLAEQSEEMEEETGESDAHDATRGKSKAKKKTRPGFRDSTAKRTTNITNMANGKSPVTPGNSMYAHPSEGNTTGAEKPTIATEGCL